MPVPMRQIKQERQVNESIEVKWKRKKARKKVYIFWGRTASIIYIVPYHFLEDAVILSLSREGSY